MVDSGIVYNHYVWFIVAIIIHTIIVNRGVCSEYKSNKRRYSTCLMFECFSQFVDAKTIQNQYIGVRIESGRSSMIFGSLMELIYFVDLPFVDPWRNGECWLPRIPFALISNGHHHHHHDDDYYYYYYYYCLLNGGIFWYESKLWHTTIVWTPN